MQQATTVPDHNFYWKRMGMLNTTYFLENNFPFITESTKPCTALS